jgi:hypothetical protein
MRVAVFDKQPLSELLQWFPIPMVAKDRIVWPTVAPIR